jgi:hypothetical protein
MDNTRVARSGEEHAARQLKDWGFTVKIHSRHPNSSDLEAGFPNKTGILVQVKTALCPEEPEAIPAEELVSLKCRAVTARKEAWYARVQVDTEGRLTKPIKWVRSW